MSASRHDLEHLKYPPFLDMSTSTKLRWVSANVSATSAFHLWIVTKQSTIIPNIAGKITETQRWCCNSLHKNDSLCKTTK